MDEFTREALAIDVERHIDADKLVDVLDRLVRQRGSHPAFVRCDNGPEMTSDAIRDWCRFSRTGAAFIESGSPRENAWVEPFGGKLRASLAVELFCTLTEAKLLGEDRRQDYNASRPHRRLQRMTPERQPSLQQPTSHQLSQQVVRGLGVRSMELGVKDVGSSPDWAEPIGFEGHAERAVLAGVGGGGEGDGDVALRADGEGAGADAPAGGDKPHLIDLGSVGAGKMLGLEVDLGSPRTEP